MKTKSNHPFRLGTRMNVCSVTKLNSIIDSSSHGGVTSRYLVSEAFETGIVNDVANWDQTLSLARTLSEDEQEQRNSELLGSLVFSDGVETVGFIFCLEDKPKILNSVSAAMFFDKNSSPQTVVTLTLGIDLPVDLLTLVSKVASLSAMIDNKLYKPSSDTASLYSDLMAILAMWKVRNKLSTPESILRAIGYGSDRSQDTRSFEYHDDVALAGVGSFSSSSGRYPLVFKN